MEDIMPSEIVKYYLYNESMFKDERPTEELLRFYEAEDVHLAAQECIKEIPIRMKPAIETDSIDEGWASISIYIDHQVIFFGLCENGFNNNNNNNNNS